MPVITLSANVVVYQGNPADLRQETNPDTLRKLHGIRSVDECADYIDQELVSSLKLTGGFLRFYFDSASESLRVSTSYGIERRPTESEMELLRSETEAQWSDGVGNGVFSFLDQEVLAASLMMAILEDEPELIADLPEFTVDACPDSNRSFDVSWSDAGGPHDLYIQDLEGAADEGNSTAQAELGYALLHGEISRQDQKAGLALLTKSADQGDQTGLVHLANAHLSGELAPLDPEKGESLLNIAISNGSAIAALVLGEAYKEGTGVAKQPERGFKLIADAAESGLPIAKAELGDSYEFGVGVKQDLNAALKWYTESLEGGFEDVQPAFDRVTQQLEDSAGVLGKAGAYLSSIFGGADDAQTNQNSLVSIEQEDPALYEAIKKAQAGLHSFVGLLRQPKPGQNSAIKVRFFDAGNTEAMWLTDVIFDGSHFQGTLGNEPENLTNIRMGDSRKVHANDVIDWIIQYPNGGAEGGYTLDLLQARQER